MLSFYIAKHFTVWKRTSYFKKHYSVKAAAWLGGMEAGVWRDLQRDHLNPMIYIPARWEPARPRYRQSILSYWVSHKDIKLRSDDFFRSLQGSRRSFWETGRTRTAWKRIKQFHVQLFLSGRRWKRTDAFSRAAKGWWRGSRWSRKENWPILNYPDPQNQKAASWAISQLSRERSKKPFKIVSDLFCLFMRICCSWEVMWPACCESWIALIASTAGNPLQPFPIASFL